MPTWRAVVSKIGQLVLSIQEDYYNMSNADFVEKYDEEKLAQMAWEWSYTPEIETMEKYVDY